MTSNDPSYLGPETPGGLPPVAPLQGPHAAYPGGPNPYPAPPPPSAGGSGSRLWLWILGLVGLVVLSPLCCCGGLLV